MTGQTSAGERARRDARARHPSSSWAPDHERLRRQLAERLAAEGHPRPLFAATLLGVRGLLGLDRQAFAAAIGLDARRVAALESGAAAPPLTAPAESPSG